MDNDKYILSEDMLPKNLTIQEFKKALKMTIMDIDNFVKTFKLLPVTTHNIYDPSGNFDPNGLFSEIIFGQLNTPQRYTTLGYIDLHTKTVLHPHIYVVLTKISSLYQDIIDCKKFVVFDEKEKDFVISDPDEFKSNTGLTYFYKYADKIDLNKKLKEAKSEKRKENIKKLIKYRNRWFISKFLVIPAGLRDLRKDQVKPQKDDINNKYLTILALSKSFQGIPEKELVSPIFNTILSSLQTKIQEVYNYLYNLIEGKYGFLQRKFGTRNTALTSRNTLIAMNINTDSPDDPNYLTSQEIQLPLVEAIKDFEPIVIHYFTHFVDTLTRIKLSKNIHVIDPDTLELTYTEISLKEQERFTNPDKVNSLINSFIDQHFRFQPVLIRSLNKKEYPIMLLYDNVKTDQIYLAHSFNILKSYFPDIKKEDIRFLTYYELLYIACVKAINDKTISSVRYPVTNKWNHNEGFIQLATTEPYRKPRVYFLTTPKDENNELNNEINKGISFNRLLENIIPFNKKIKNIDSIKGLSNNKNVLIDESKMYKIFSYGNSIMIEYFKWPDIYQGQPIDAISIPTCFYRPMDADVDGDQLSTYSVLSNEANQEIKKELKEISRYVLPSMKFSIPPDSLSYKILKYLTY